ncbi:C1QL [Mytilus edulis]|uniref:C1QL n=1 Tax=Mytilus edulis TaxID=6550 RepID=A0A8S3VCL3_MYTED|nr:C1QL [Mytilus edulis]
MLKSVLLVFVVTGYVIAESSCHTADGLYEVSIIGRSVVVIPGAGRRLVYDVTKTNEGNGYNRHTGVFTCPKTGIYVFTWVTRMCYSEHSTELMINNTIYGSTFLRAKDGDDGSVSGTVVAHVSKGDTVYVRNQLIYGGDGRILSNVLGRTSFSGWLLQ